ncbi:HEAT repeat domain-containing protein [Pseudodesulfovibrio sp. JC047]|uniref:HEAT repeat domain-containing protein n=1 Tax=Pseudodesulfovibrio sp. JC047 TaxID=2683199 RepID=UPI0013D66654|nr:HEAT repeat domain-containing protein [Pseudodesulfovibrio sp. JC047]
MQPYTDEFARANLTHQPSPLTIEGIEYLAHVEKGTGYILATTADEQNRLPIEHVLGGKYVYYFLTPMDKGRLQTLPLAYDVVNKEWFDMAGSGIRHTGGDAVSWTDAAFTFNTSCHGCHVSQLRNNYDQKTGRYETTWAEPGINCETCHGPSSEHNRVCREAEKGTVPDDLKILGGKGKFTVQQNSDACAPCHAQMIPLTGSFMPGDAFYDHFDLTTLEDPDWYPDGRDLGENYTHTTWSLSPCVQSGALGCVHCHTSSGRFRQKNAPNTACAPCHDAKVSAPGKHTMHTPGPDTPTCLSCHMHKTRFARMDRSDHSMLPPTPATTMAFGSPNACNGCHTDKDAAWADSIVRQWRSRDYQAPILHRAGLVDAARNSEWSKLPAMTAYITDPNSDPIFVTSLIRLLRACPMQDKWPAILSAMEHSSPLVRSAAAEALTPPRSPEALQALVQATGDPVRLVRIRAAAALTGVPMHITKGEHASHFEAAKTEYLHSLTARPDLWTSHYNLGNYYLLNREFRKARIAFREAHDIAPQAIPPLVNNAMAHARMNDLKGAELLLMKALKLAPEAPAILYNLGLLKSELNKIDEAETYLRASLKADPQLAGAAYNLSVLVGEKSPGEAIEFAQTASDLREDPRYAFNLAFAQHRGGHTEKARTTLKNSIKNWPEFTDAYLYLLNIAETPTQQSEAKKLIATALSSHTLSPASRARLKQVF